MRLILLDAEFTGLDDPDPFLISLGLVDEEGRHTFYAELEASYWERKAELWTWRNVVPLLESGPAMMPVGQVGWRLRQWIRSFNDDVRIICDSPEHDWKLVVPLLEPDWPESLARQAFRFDSYAIGPDSRAWLREVVGGYHGPDRPAHHALDDAQALRAGWLAARGSGWMPTWLESGK